MKKILFSCFMAMILVSAPAFSQDEVTEQEVSAMKALLEKKNMSADQVTKTLDNFREMPKMQRDQMMDQLKSNLQKNVPKKEDVGEIDGVQRGKPKTDKMKENGDIMQDKADKMKEKGEGMQDKADKMKEKGEAMKDKAKEMKEKGERMKDKANEMKEKGEGMKEEMKGKKEAMKDKMNGASDKADKMNPSGKKDWSKMSGKEFGKATSEWAKTNGKRCGNLKERVGKTAVRMEAANSKIEKAKERLALKKESGEISEEDYNEKMSKLAKYEERIKDLNDKSKGKAELIEKVEKEASSVNITK